MEGLGAVAISVIAVMVVPLGVWVRIFFARSRAIREGDKEVSLFGGYVQVVLWDPHETLVILRRKKIKEIIAPAGDAEFRVGGVGGGTRLIFPIIGDEVRARAPVRSRELEWEDKDVLTRESLQIGVKVAVWWRVTNLAHYVFRLEPVAPMGTGAVESAAEAAEKTLRTLTETTLRTLVSRTEVAKLISSRPMNYLLQSAMRVEGQPSLPSTAGSEAANPELLSDTLRREIGAKACYFGLEVRQVAIKQVSLAEHIQEAIDRAWKASLLPITSQQEARARQIELQALAEVLGVEALAIKEAFSGLPQNSVLFSLPKFFDRLFTARGASGPSQTGASSGI